MENKYFLHAHMMNEHGVLNMEDDNSRQPQHSNSGLPAAVATSPSTASTPPPTAAAAAVSVSLPQYPADLSKLAESGFRLSGLNIPCPLISSPSPVNNGGGGGLAKLSEKSLDFPKSLFDQIQGLPRHPASFLDQMKRDLGAKMEGAGGVPLSPLKRPSLDRDPNKKPASLSRSYCEICKKELCNKYFMKTHMMKMHGIVMDQSSGGGGGGHHNTSSNSNNSGGGSNNNVNCEICKKEVSSRYFLKVHMASAHGLNEDGTPLREMGGGSLLNLFPMGDFPPPPPLPPHMGEFSRLLMQQGEKSLEQRLKELDRLKEQQQQQGHICSLCSQNFPDIVSLQVHIIKSHGALPPGAAGLDSLFHHHHNHSSSNRKHQQQHRIEEADEERNSRKNNNNLTEAAAAQDATMMEDEEDDIAEPEIRGGGQRDEQQPNFPLPLEKPAGLEMLHRQLAAGGGQFPAAAMLGPAVLLGGGLPGFGGPGGQQQQQFQGLFNMFLSEMLKKVQKDTPPQTPPVSPTATPPNGNSPPPSSQETAAASRMGETTTS
jgi:hypothetical protein